MLVKHKKPKPRISLFIMANTHDAELNTACKKDVRKVRQSFALICKHIHYNLSILEISGSNYNEKNLLKAIESIPLHTEMDVLIFYYTGHGFSYEKDGRNMFPQIDIRAHNNQVRYNKIDFIEKYTLNLTAVLNMMRFNGARINIAIGDCCNSIIPFTRSKDSVREMQISKDVLPTKSKVLNKKIYTNEKRAISILVGSSQHGQPAVSDASIGSIFTHHFTQTLINIITALPKGSQYVPWVPLIKKTSTKSFKDSKKYDVGGGKAGKQKAVFEVFVDVE
jgi:hypothetical protein